ncbi:alanine racemase [Candidatus Amoebophilus asiaticus]|uniref:alanine racemase n=1 Tax=Candidatus Amoebophilus asiaticus TaxID=281120 RepID=UPI0001715F6E|nr:alanine racemase [Candidatus Amoebophilus asiaticus]
MRINLEQGINRCQLVYDTYRNDWVSLQHVLGFVAEQGFTQKKSLILTDLNTSEIDIDKLYSELAQLLQTQQIYQLIGVGTKMLTYAHKFLLPETHFFENLTSMLASGLLDKQYGSVVIVKGATIRAVDSVVARLQKKCYDTVLEIDIGAIQHNLNFFRSKLAAPTQVIAMVKASAYGSGSYGIAHLLQQSRVDYLAVAYADEGVTLRENGIYLPIMVMNPSPVSFTKLLAHRLEPVIYSLRLLHDWLNFLSTTHTQLGFHIKLDTGMHRLGFMEQEIDKLTQALQNQSSLSIKSVCSHLAAPGTQRHNAYTHAQAKLFQQMVQRIEGKLGIMLPKHLLNTAGTQLFPEYQFDMVRLGIGLYGFTKGIQQYLKVASTLKTIISQIKEIPIGATIGYERKGLAQRPTKIATLAIGYADGFRRSLSNGHGKVWINGKLAPVIGNVCMDMAMVDITGIEANEGEEAIIFGKELPITHVASAMDTIVYEVLTNVDERVRKVYYKEFACPADFQ